ncbi:MAG: flagellar motor protein MotB [Phycisphaerales bacterium JB058]
MAKKGRPPPPGVPEWVVTYGDLMSLLLCFFILLAAFSEIKQEREYLDVIRSIQEAFGYTGGAGQVDTDTPPTNSQLSQFEKIVNSMGRETRNNESRNPSTAGPNPTSSYVAQGPKTVVGSTIPFEGGSSELTSTTQEYLVNEVVPKLRGLRFNVEVRGHAFGREDRAAAGDVYTMGFQRAKAVMDFLVLQGIESSRLSVTSVGSSEPISTNVNDKAAMGQNRRVQIILTEVLPDDVHPDPNGTSPTVR